MVGGYVHRGADEGMQGRYLYADFVTDQLWSLRLVGGRAVDVTNHSAQLVGAPLLRRSTSFAEDARGNLYVVGIGGTVARLRFGAGAGDAADRIVGGGRATTGCSAAPATTRSHGGRGRDRLDGGGQDDRLRGGAGADLLRCSAPGRGADTVVDFRDDVDAHPALRGFGFACAGEALDARRGDGRRRRLRPSAAATG